MDYLIYNTLDYPVISTVLLLPLAGAIITLFLPDGTGKQASLQKIWGTLVTLITAAAAMPLFFRFDPSSHLYQFAERHNWIRVVNLEYVVGVDGISLLLVMLTVLIMPVVILSSFSYIGERHKEFIVSILLMETVMLGVFVSLNTILFFVFWEAMLVPMYLLIAVWGGKRKDYAAVKFFLYTLLGSVFMVITLIFIYVKTNSFFIPQIMEHSFGLEEQVLIFLALALAFAVKVPMFPLHTWLPAAHVEAPAPGSVVLAAVLLKMGGYGFLRFCIPMAPAATYIFAPAFIIVSLISILAGGYLALGQTDLKKLIAYSSVGHMGFVTLGVFVLSATGIQGAIIQMVNHGITSGALFVCAGLLYERTHSREIVDNSALGKAMPIFLSFFVLFSLSAFGFPGTNSFVGEMMILVAAFKAHPLIGAAAIPGAVLAAAYMLRLTQKMIWDDDDGHGHGKHDNAKGWDLNPREILTLAFLGLFVLWIGLNPAPLLEVTQTSVAHLVDQYQAGIDAMPKAHHALIWSLTEFLKGLI